MLFDILLLVIAGGVSLHSQNNYKLPLHQISSKMISIGLNFVPNPDKV